MGDEKSDGEQARPSAPVYTKPYNFLYLSIPVVFFPYSNTTLLHKTTSFKGVEESAIMIPV